MQHAKAHIDRDSRLRGKFTPRDQPGQISHT